MARLNYPRRIEPGQNLFQVTGVTPKRDPNHEVASLVADIAIEGSCPPKLPTRRPMVPIEFASRPHLATLKRTFEGCGGVERKSGGLL